MTKIEWTDKTWNPVTGCNKVSDGCKFCYAEIMHKRQMGMNPKKYSRPFLDGAFPYPEALPIPLKFRKQYMIFVNSMSDLFHDMISMDYIARVYAIMFLAEKQVFQVLTKRTARAKTILNDDNFLILVTKYANMYYDKYIRPLDGWLYSYDEIRSMYPFKNIWYVGSVENQEQANIRIAEIMETPSVVRGLSCEPLLSSIQINDVTLWKDAAKWWGAGILNPINNYRIGDNTYGINWVIAGGESGSKARPMHPDWVREIRDQCVNAKVPFFFKQWGEWGQSSAQYPGTKGNFMLMTADKTIVELKQYPRQFSMFGMKGIFVKTGKKFTGNFLDGMQFKQFPEVK